MKNNVFDLSFLKHRAAMLEYADKACARCGIPVSHDAFVTFQNRLVSQQEATLYRSFLFAQNSDWEDLLSNMQTNNLRFLIVGVQNHYKDGLNPVFAYYNELQKAQFTLDRRDGRRKWLESFLHKEKWRVALLDAIKGDIAELDDFIDTWHHTSLTDDLTNKAIEMRRRMQDCLLTFSKTR